MQILLVFLISIIVTALQLVLMPRLAVLAIAPNLILSSVLAWTIFQPAQKKNWLILIPVFVFELMAGYPFGLTLISLWLVAFFIEKLEAVLFKQNNFLAILSLIFLGILFFEICQYALSYLFSVWRLTEPAKLTAFYFSRTLPVIFGYNGILSLFLFWLLNKTPLFNSYGSFAKIK